MREEHFRFKKSRRSGVNGNCVEVGHTLRHIRDSKNFSGSPLGTVDVARLIESVRYDRLSR
jgi:hypothetical protein